ncbi:MAG: NAD-dependent epimerase/dehydratase family protein [Planctomycetota bacterium]|nr:NAD-dependent epimerase/dehydratase family protein [Planctomycetota bacterium]
MKALVTGGGGFLGGAIVRQLLERGADVRSFSRGEHPWLKKLGVEQVRGDLCDLGALRRAAAGREIVFHAAAMPGIWGPYAEYHRVNVTGTGRVLEVCRESGVGKLVFTGSPSVTFDGSDQDGVDESAPYPARWLAHYPHTKALAEQLVLAANGAALATVSLRPHLVWGPRDNHLVPRLIARAKAGKLRLIRAPGKRVDSVYIENAAEAHLLAAEKLAPGATCAGRAYFITNGEPLPMGELINGILRAAGLPPVTKTLSPRTAYLAGCVMEGWYGLLSRRSEPLMTRFLARQLGTSHWFKLDRARVDLGYEPRVSIARGLEELARYLRESGRA